MHSHTFVLPFINSLHSFHRSEKANETMNMLSAQTQFHYTSNKGAATLLQKCSDQSLANIIAANTHPFCQWKSSHCTIAKNNRGSS